MKKLLPTAAAAVAATLCLAAAHAAQWSYQGANGPEHWGTLSPDYSVCERGQNQSPINIQGALKTASTPLTLHYQDAAGKTIVNNGHTIQIDFDKGNTLTLDGHQFDLVQVHFHAPAENEINGKRYPLEAHFVNADAQGKLAVVAVMFQAGSPNASLARIWSQMPASPGPAAPLPVKSLPSSLLPASLSYYRYSGSLTTPPCSEGVRWLVLQSPVHASPTQIRAFEQRMGQATNRPVQPLNGRVIVK